MRDKVHKPTTHATICWSRTESTFRSHARLALRRAQWYHVDRCRRAGIHAQAARQVGPLFEQFLRIAAAQGLDVREKPIDNASVQRCVLLGFSDQLAKRLDAASLRCELVHSRRGTLARESVVKAPLLVVSEAREVARGPSR